MRRVPESEQLYELVGRNIKDLREKAKLSQTALSVRCGRTRGSIANIELGKQRPTLHTLWTLADALDVEPRALIPTRVELEGPSADTDTVPKTTRRVEKAAGGSRDKVASFIAATRQEVRPDDRIREEGKKLAQASSRRRTTGRRREGR